MIAKQFHISGGAVQWTVTLFLISYAIAQLIYGPIANRLGRKPTLYIGLTVAMLGSLLCAFSDHVLHSFVLLLIARLIQAIGASVGLVLTFTIINDFYYPEQARKITAYTTTAFAIMPGLSVTIGGYLTEYLGWASCFYFLTGYFFVTLMLTSLLPETHQPSAHPESEETAFKKYWLAFSHFPLTGYSLLLGSTTVMIYLFSSNSPILMINHLHFSPSVFGLINLIPSAMYLIGNMVVANTAKKFSARPSILFGIIAIAICSIALFILACLNALSVYSLIIPIAIVYFFIPMVYTNSSVLAIGHYPDKASASATLAFINMATATVGVLVTSVLSSALFLFVGILYVFFTALMLVLFISLKNKVATNLNPTS